MQNHPPIYDNENPTHCYCGQPIGAAIHTPEEDDVDPELVHEIEDSNDNEISEDGM